MAQPRIGVVLRRLRLENGATQRELAVRLGVSASYLNLIEHDQRAVTASLLFKLTDVLGVPIEVLAGDQERQREIQLRDALSDPAIGVGPIPQADLAMLATHPAAARAVLALAHMARTARGVLDTTTPGDGRHGRGPTDEDWQAYRDQMTYVPELEDAAEAIRMRLGRVSVEGIGQALGQRPYLGHAIAKRLRGVHGFDLQISEAPAGRNGVCDKVRHTLRFSDRLPRESRVFRMAVQLAALEASDTINRLVRNMAPNSQEAEAMVRDGLVKYAAAALLMPYKAFHAATLELRYDIERLASRFGVSFEQAAQRTSTLQRPGARGLQLFFVSMDAAANIIKSVSLCGFPIARHDGSCPRWVANTAFQTPGRIQVQVAELAHGPRFLCVARTVAAPALAWGDVVPMRTVVIGCAIGDARSMVYGDGISLDAAAVAIGAACRICDWRDCRQRAYPRVAAA